MSDSDTSMDKGQEAKVKKEDDRELAPTQQKERRASFIHMLPIGISMMALVVSLIQWNTANEAATITAYDRAVSPVIELDKAYLANSDLRPYFYDNKILKDDDPHHSRVLILAEMTLDCFEILVTQTLQHRTRFAGRDQQDRQWMIEAFRNSKVLRDYLQRRARWYSGELHDLAQQSIRSDGPAQ